ncbi:TPR repeat-containing protein [Sediminibacterium ginsengisoli]|uniref:TPR repeat-containing protein n=2 Tax=Sediminibacterium ginsengisoli TaxID=413434 RepID=A0A1T4JTG8_9BACT|nr:TPR repeat-containing protein [Sediminibacterium ginsengisoli]
MLLTGGGLVLLILLYFFGKTVSPAKSDTAKTNVAPVNQVVKFDDLLVKAKEHISAEQNARLTALENAVVRGDVKEQQIHVYHQLARFWADSAHIFEPYAWYTAEAAKLENSEKSLTFAAHLFLDNLITEGEPAIQTWLATNAKDLLEKALAINPGNDSSKIGLGACYMFGNISDNPMQGILPVREIVEKHPENLYGQKILGLGGRKSGQYDKAIDRFKIILQYEPKNVEAMLNIAECYELKGDKKDAVNWYQKARDLIAIPEAKTALNKRIEELKH